MDGRAADPPPCVRQTEPYTERMFGYHEGSGRLGTRRLGGPILFKDIWPALREELREVYVARGGLACLDPGRFPDEPGTPYADHRSGADAFT